MPAGTQELLALAVVAVVVGLTLWRRARKRRSGAACSGCDSARAKKPAESTVRFFRRRP